jgi:hypothetical protein
VIVGIIRHVLVALFYGSLYWHISPTATQSRLSLLFFAIMFVMLGNQQVSSLRPELPLRKPPALHHLDHADHSLCGKLAFHPRPPADKTFLAAGACRMQSVVSAKKQQPPPLF